jgi:8-oxo-dGTP pyrophosphatase MutT (NUDIX family)
MSKQEPAPRRVHVDVLHEGRWLCFQRIEYADRHGRSRTWEATSRRAGQSAVCVIARLRPSNRYILVEQYRPAVAAGVIEFPAGLIDPGEAAHVAARRELLEETGYEGVVRWLSPPALNSPGLTDESAVLVLMDIDEDTPVNRAPQPRHDDGEDIRVHLVTAEEIPGFLDRCTGSGLRVDNKVLAFFLGQGVLPGDGRGAVS